MTWPPHQMTWHASKQVISPPWNSRRQVHSKEMVWASRWSVALRTFYRQILSLTYSFFSWKLPPPACPALLVFPISKGWYFSSSTWNANPKLSGAEFCVSSKRIPQLIGLPQGSRSSPIFPKAHWWLRCLASLHNMPHHNPPCPNQTQSESYFEASVWFVSCWFNLDSSLATGKQQ